MAKEKKYRIREIINSKGKSTFVAEYQYSGWFNTSWYNIVNERSWDSNCYKSLKKAKKALAKYRGKQYASEIIHEV